LLWVALDAGDDGVREWVGLGALVLGLDDDDLCSDGELECVIRMNEYSVSVCLSQFCFLALLDPSAYLLACISSTADNGDTADLEDCRRLSQYAGVSIDGAMSCAK